MGALFWQYYLCPIIDLVNYRPGHVSVRKEEDFELTMGAPAARGQPAAPQTAVSLLVPFPQ
jgi:hypothetical protein